VIRSAIAVELNVTNLLLMLFIIHLLQNEFHGNNGLSELLFLVDKCDYWAAQELIMLQRNVGWGR
jgi:hypothetical protein